MHHISREKKIPDRVCCKEDMMKDTFLGFLQSHLHCSPLVYSRAVYAPDKTTVQRVFVYFLSTKIQSKKSMTQCC